VIIGSSDPTSDKAKAAAAKCHAKLAGIADGVAAADVVLVWCVGVAAGWGRRRRWRCRGRRGRG
jgi:hypothetical protein